MNIKYTDVNYRNILIKRYLSYDLNELDVMVFFVSDDLLSVQPDAFLTCDILSNYMAANKDDIDQSLSKLIKKGFIKIQKGPSGFISSVDQFKEKLFDDLIKDFILKDKAGKDYHQDSETLLNDLEELQGRTLSPLERDQVFFWLKENATEGMIKEACHKALTKKGTISFKEADRLLMDMKRSQSRKTIGVSTVNEETKKNEELRELFNNSDWTFHGEK